MKSSKKKPAERTDVTISVADEHLANWDEVAEGLKSEGFHVDQAMKNSGVFTGSVDSAKLAGLHKVKGVSAVEASRNYQIAPPDSDVQ